MDSASLVQLGGLLAFSFVFALAALWSAARLWARPAPAPSLFEPDDADTYLFDGDSLIDASPEAAEAFNRDPFDGSDWQRFLEHQRAAFPDLEARVAELPENGRKVVLSRDGSARLVIENRSGLIRITRSGQPPERNRIILDRPGYEAMRKELRTLRETARRAPFLLWCQDSEGTVTWANNAYLELAGKGAVDPEAPPWPPARLFDLHNARPGDTPVRAHRITAHIAGESEPRWFECFETPLEEESLFMAVSADKVVKAEIALRDFVQTLTKTFAHLTVGLAIFDRTRRLTLFNPALMDLTALPADFLSARPTLHAFLDRLRQKRMLPEPKDYKSWRQQFQELETAAENGTYEETWSLANGSTYRVIGRPHPDGALAFVFEDISAEISLTRRFRAELETGQAVLDTLDEAIAVFSPGGALTLSNRAYGALWEVDTSTILGQFGIIDATRLWSEHCAPSPVWGDAREFVSAPGPKAEWSADVRLLDGRALRCRFVPIAGGATLVGFRLLETAAAHPDEVPAGPGEERPAAADRAAF